MSKNTPSQPPDTAFAETLSSDRPLARRTFIKVSSLIGTALPLVVSLTPMEARAQSSTS